MRPASSSIFECQCPDNHWLDVINSACVACVDSTSDKGGVLFLHASVYADDADDVDSSGASQFLKFKSHTLHVNIMDSLLDQTTNTGLWEYVKGRPHQFAWVYFPERPDSDDEYTSDWDEYSTDYEVADMLTIAVP